MKGINIVVSLLFVSSSLLAANNLANSKGNTISSDTVLSNFHLNLDSVLNLFYLEQCLETDEYSKLRKLDTTTVNFAAIPDSVIIERLNNIPSVVNLSYNKIVRRYIEMYTTEKRRNVEVMLGLANYYFPLFDEIFDYYDIPNEMKYMSIIESALNPRAVSRAGAVGLWQFMYGTGRIYGLTINSLIDERRDPIQSTHAAARFVKDLYRIYKDWILVIAAYNCGPGNVNRAIRRSGGKKNYWDIYYYLPRETRGHVPAFIAATYTMHYYREHNLYQYPVELPEMSDTIMVSDKLHLKQVAEVLNIPLKLLRDMNPQYRADVIPAGDQSFALRLPVEKTLQFIDYQDSIFAYKDSVFFNPENAVTSPKRYSSSRYYHHPPPGNMEKLVYTVKSGDNLGYIASWYNVRLSDLRYWNNIRRNLIRSGQKLVIYKPKSKVEKYKPINNMSFVEKQRMIGKQIQQNNEEQLPPTDSREYVYYTVKYGDTLWDIAKQFPGVTDTEIMNLNNLNHASKIYPGQKIKIKRKI